MYSSASPRPTNMATLSFRVDWWRTKMVECVISWSTVSASSPRPSLPGAIIVEDGVLEEPGRRIGPRAAHVDVEALLGELGREAVGLLALEPAEVREAPHEGEAPALRREGQGMRRAHDPNHRRPIDLHVLGVVRGRRQAVGLAEGLDGLHLREQAPEPGIHVPAVDELVDVS